MVTAHHVLEKGIFLHRCFQSRTIDNKVGSQCKLGLIRFTGGDLGQQLPALVALQALDLSKVELIPALAQPTIGHALPVFPVSCGRPSPVVEQPVSLLVTGTLQLLAH